MANKKHNALKHGASATEVMLWSERYKDYESLRDGLCEEFAPSGSTEEYLVGTLLDLLWRKRRLQCREQIEIQKRLDKIRADNENSHHIDKLRSLLSSGKPLAWNRLRQSSLLSVPSTGTRSAIDGHSTLVMTLSNGALK